MKNATIITLTFATLLTTGLMAGNASATVCTSHYVTATASSAGAIAKFRKRRAERRAVNAWEKKVTAQYGKNHANFKGNVRFGTTSRGNTSATAAARIVVCR